MKIKISPQQTSDNRVSALKPSSARCSRAPTGARYHHVPAGMWRGFTLIEIIMVLAISSLLALILLGNYQATQQRERFRDGVERAVTLLERVKNEANTTVNVDGDGDNPSRLVFAKAVVFTDESSDMEVVSLSAVDREVLSGLQASNTRVEQLPWQIQFNGDRSSHRAVVFTRNVTNGNINTFVLDTDNVTDRSQYVDTAAARNNTIATGRLVLQNPAEGFRATIRVDAATNEITRTYDN